MKTAPAAVLSPGWQPTLAPALEALRGLRPRHLAAALAVAVFFALLRGLYLFEAYAQGQALLPKLPGQMLSGICLVLAVLIADAYVRQGARPILAYGAAVFTSAVLAAVMNYYLTLALGGENFYGPDVPLAVRRTQMLFNGILRMVESGFPVAAYLQWRDREAMAIRLQASEMRRARAERRIQQTLLRALQARVDPELLFGALQRAGELADIDSARADRLLDDVIALLRLLMPADAPATDRLGPTIEDELAIVAAYLRVRDGCVGAKRELHLAIDASAAGARLRPMLLLSVARAIAGGEESAPSPLEIRAVRDGGLLELIFSRPGGHSESFIIDADLSALQARLDETFGQGAARVVVGDSATRLTVRLGLDR